MSEVECARCGESFDTERMPQARGQDMSRCPQCGYKHDADETDAGDGEQPLVVEVHIHVHRE